MTIADQIHEKVERLPESTQAEVLDFVEYLLHRSRQEDLLGSKVSRRWALRGAEDEVWPDYNSDYLKESWE